MTVITFHYFCWNCKLCLLSMTVNITSFLTLCETLLLSLLCMTVLPLLIYLFCVTVSITSTSLFPYSKYDYFNITLKYDCFDITLTEPLLLKGNFVFFQPGPYFHIFFCIREWWIKQCLRWLQYWAGQAAWSPANGLQQGGSRQSSPYKHAFFHTDRLR